MKSNHRSAWLGASRAVSRAGSISMREEKTYRSLGAGSALSRGHCYKTCRQGTRHGVGFGVVQATQVSARPESGEVAPTAPALRGAVVVLAASKFAIDPGFDVHREPSTP